MHIHAPALRSRVPRVLAAAALVLLSAGALQAQGDRAARLLSDRPAPRRDCRIAERPDPLPALGQIADSVALAAGVATYAQQNPAAEGSPFSLYSILFAVDGTVERVAPIESTVPEAQAEALHALVRQSIRRQSVGGFSVRLRVEPGAAQPLRVGASETCPPTTNTFLGLDTNFGTRTFNLRPVRVQAAIAADGAVKGVELLNTSGNDEVDRWVEHSVARWKFTPALVDGIATAVTHIEQVRIRTR